MPITHAFVNPKADGSDTTVTRPSDWNAAHVFDIVPGWMSWFSGTTDSTNFYWNGSDLAGFTTQTVSGSATWAENGNSIQALFTGQSLSQAAVKLIAKTFSIGTQWVLAVNTTMMASDTTNSTTQYDAIGIVFADGTGTTANCVIGHMQNDWASTTTLLVGRFGTLSNVNVGAPWVSATQHTGGLGGWVFVRLTYQAANTFRLEWGPTPYQFTAFGEADISQTMTPTHVGLYVSGQSLRTVVGMFGPLKKTA